MRMTGRKEIELPGERPEEKAAERQLRIGRKHARFNFVGRFDCVVDGGSALVAVQPRLGLLPKRNSGSCSRHPDCVPVAGVLLRTVRQAPACQQKTTKTGRNFLFEEQVEKS